MNSHFSLTISCSNSFTPSKFADPPVTTNPPFTFVSPSSCKTSKTSKNISSTLCSIKSLKSFEYIEHVHLNQLDLLKRHLDLKQSHKMHDHIDVLPFQLCHM